ncbi:MAG TPA: SO_0444 family Cu/Zn efflux transporter [Phycisphaerae bacterium]|nr:SO_0444 family Cu/Zn efflux transporter [Phycisphaerae bacterium]HRY70565.1 SO_0444 family Cu/Zn efflux transporter [Phycisphaerae bacterium]HSA28385.1 SO_0444 family Cu/Zn efflux transporter [Phycisphaerae bacterium]
MAFVVEWATATWEVFLQAGPWLFFGFLAAGVIHALVPVGQVTRHLGKPGLGGVIKAALVGAPLPLCSCSVIPVASSIRRQGASRGATASFLISTPETGVDSIAISYALLGPFMAVVRPIAALATAVFAGWLIDRSDRSGNDSAQRVSPSQASPKPCCHHCSSEASVDAGERVGLFGRAGVAVRYGFVEMFADLAHWLVLGFVLAGLVSAVVPPGSLERYIGSGWTAMLIMLAIGMPMYVCATSSTPIAAALIAKGLSPGAALVFLLVGPATNMTTMVIVGRQLGRRSLAIYIASIAVVAILFGLGTDALLSSAPVAQAAVVHHSHHESGLAGWPFAIVLLLFIINGLRLRVGKWSAARRPRPPVAVSLPLASQRAD